MKKIPKHATKVFEGGYLNVYQWDQEMYDGTTTPFFAIKRDPSTEVIAVTHEGKVLIAEQEQPNRPKYLSLFGGSIESGEDPLASAKRELLEETGYVSDDWTLVEVTQFPWQKLDWESHLFVAKNCRKVQDQQLDNGEKITVREVEFDEFLALGAEEIRWSRPEWLYDRTVNSAGADRLRALVE